MLRGVGMQIDAAIAMGHNISLGWLFGLGGHNRVRFKQLLGKGKVVFVFSFLFGRFVY